MTEDARQTWNPTAEQESKCRRCGMSCHFAIEYAGERLIIPEIHCLYLGREGSMRQCTVYDQRFELAPWCQTSDEASVKGFLGWDCPYAAGRSMPGGGKRWATEAQRRAIMPHVLKALVENGLERKYNPDSALSLLSTSGESWSYRFEADKYRFYRTDSAPQLTAKQ